MITCYTVPSCLLPYSSTISNTTNAQPSHRMLVASFCTIILDWTFPMFMEAQSFHDQHYLWWDQHKMNTEPSVNKAHCYINSIILKVNNCILKLSPPSLCCICFFSGLCLAKQEQSQKLAFNHINVLIIEQPFYYAVKDCILKMYINCKLT